LSEKIAWKFLKAKLKIKLNIVFEISKTKAILETTEVKMLPLSFKSFPCRNKGHVTYGTESKPMNLIVEFHCLIKTKSKIGKSHVISNQRVCVCVCV
jgi:hypothetical protein